MLVHDLIRSGDVPGSIRSGGRNLAAATATGETRGIGRQHAQSKPIWSRWSHFLGRNGVGQIDPVKPLQGRIVASLATTKIKNHTRGTAARKTCNFPSFFELEASPLKSRPGVTPMQKKLFWGLLILCIPTFLFLLSALADDSAMMMSGSLTIVPKSGGANPPQLSQGPTAVRRHPRSSLSIN